MNIALVGVPGSGKTDLAYPLAQKLEEEDRTVKIIDNYVPEIEARTQIAMGMMADYIGNLYVALERYALERMARMDHDVVITCGTFLETAVYMSMHMVSMANTMSDVEKAATAPRLDGILRLMAVLYNDICGYDHAFYLPPQSSEPDLQFMDQQLQAGLGGFKLIPVKTLLNPEKRLEEALEALEADEVQPA